MPSKALELTAIHKSFDGHAALTDAHFDLQWGEVHALLGENGAGKSSLMNIAAGLYAPESGRIAVDDNPVAFGGPRDAARQRIGMVHQHFKLVRPFTVAENILLHAAPDQPGRSGGSHGKRLRQMEDAVRAKAVELGFAIDPRRRVDALSIAEQQRVEILKVLLAGARILILDEPTAVLTDQEAERLLATMVGLARSGSAVVLVTHKMADVKAHADRVTVMRGGRTVVTVDPRVTPVAELIRLTVGASVPPPERVRSSPGPVRLTVRGLRSLPVKSSIDAARPALDGVDLQLREGEVYGIAGVGGNGQSELAGAVMGLPGGFEGSITLEGYGDLKHASTSARRACGMATIPADRYGLALAGELTIAENFGIGQMHDGRYGSAWRVASRKLADDAARAVHDFDVQGVRGMAQKAALLSGGNAQKLVIAREFSKPTKLVLAHSPSRGLDVRAGAAVQQRLLAARDAGAAVLLISEDLDEVLALSDRIGVMNRGRIVAEFEQPFDRQAIGEAMVDHG